MNMRDFFDRSFRPIRVVSTKLFRRKVLSDFRWGSYTDFDYEPQLRTILDGGQRLILSESQRQNIFDSHFLEGIDGVMSPHFLLYKTCINLQPKSILEVGAGAGYHLVNLSNLLPNVEMKGIDLLQTQVNLGKRIFPEYQDLIGKIAIGNFATNPLPHHLTLNADLVYCQAVTMHIPLKAATQMVKNMIAVANRHVLLLENISITHNYERLMRQVLDEVGGFSYEIVPIVNHPFGMVKITRDLESPE